MSRTTATAVQGIIEHDSNISLTPFVEAANNMVTKHCSGVSDYSAADLELIERWLTAHFYAIRDPRASAERAGKVSQTLKSKVDLGLSVTHYGQMAMQLDWAGGLAALDQRIKKGLAPSLGFTWLGAEEGELEDDEE